MKAFLVVDVQNDFCPGGALAVAHGDSVVPVINRLMKFFPLVVASKDWHPPGSVHFRKWPVHCVQETQGAEFHPDLDASRIQQVFYKGTEDKDDGYSAFEATNLNLAEFLAEKGVTELTVAGLATDYCVKASAMDAAARGFRTTVVKDAVAAVNVNSGDDAKAFAEMRKAGIAIVRSEDVKQG